VFVKKRLQIKKVLSFFLGFEMAKSREEEVASFFSLDLVMVIKENKRFQVFFFGFNNDHKNRKKG
jgi:hypothetical protein